MLSRPVQFFLALVLFWSGFAIQVQAGSAAAGEQQLEVQLTGDLPHCDRADPTDHGADDRPVQAQAEGGTDLPALVQQLAAAQIAFGVVRPGPHRMAAWLAPTLDGLRRPPRGRLSSA